LRVQIYSLSNGYHRHLVLTGMAQKKWQSLTVDMTEARRPDGTGGALAEGERIDDIQFYCDPKAALVIDDIVLYDASAEGEKRPFPKKVHFTGWFDSGKQGREWPGTFDIAFNKGAFWHAARSVDGKEGASIKLNLRGRRPLGEKTHLSFRYLLTGGERLRVRVGDSKADKSHMVERKSLTKGKWSELTLDFSALKDSADEIEFLADKGSELLVDDVLLYEPGS
jgi:hypothetical protein